MSLTLCITTPEGIVLAADSRQSYRNNQNMVRIGSDSATKVFPVNDRIGVTVSGPAFLLDPKDPNKVSKGIGTFINDYIDTIDDGITVEDVAKGVKKHLMDIYQPGKQLDQAEKELKKQIDQKKGTVIKLTRTAELDRVIANFTLPDGSVKEAFAGIIPITLIVAGYDLPPEKGDGKQTLSVFMVNVPGKVLNRRNGVAPNPFGADWTGQTDVVSRIILAKDPRLGDLDTYKAAVQNMGEDKVNKDYARLEYAINWGAMTLFDAIDFASLMIQTTSAIQRFSDGVIGSPGDMPGVGGPIDIAVISPNKGFFWHQKKTLNLTPYKES